MVSLYILLCVISKKGKILNHLQRWKNLPLKIVQLDITDDRSVKNAIQSITTETSGIDVLVNNAVIVLAS
jgi:NADP-dependent 3-hydroxy acid dehydrogenase YdfG